MAIIRNKQNITDKETKEYILSKMQDNPTKYNAKGIEHLKNAIAGMKREKVKTVRQQKTIPRFIDAELTIGQFYWVMVDKKPHLGVLTEKIVRLKEAKRNRTQLKSYQLSFNGVLRVVKLSAFISRGKQSGKTV